MKEFIEWLRYKKVILSTHQLSYVSTRAFVIEENGVIYAGSDTDIEKLPKQLLVGYMIEYLQDNRIEFEITSNKMWNIESVFEELKKLIKAL